MSEVIEVLKQNPSLAAIVAYVLLREILNYFKDSTKKNIEVTEINTRTLIRVETKLEHFEKTLEEMKKQYTSLEAKVNKHEGDIRGYNYRLKELEK